MNHLLRPINFTNHIPLRWSGRPKTHACYRHIAPLERKSEDKKGVASRAIQFSSFSLHFREDRDSEIAPTEERLEHQMRIIGQLNGSVLLGVFLRKNSANLANLVLITRCWQVRKLTQYVLSCPYP